MTLPLHVAALNWYRITLVDRVIAARERTGKPMLDEELKAFCADVNDLTRGWELSAPSRNRPSVPSPDTSLLTPRKVFQFLPIPRGIVAPTDLLTDRQWGLVDGDACRVFQYSPFGWVEEGRVCIPKRVPYAAIHFECTKIQGTVKGYITHKLDFLHLWQAFIERGVSEDEEVIVYWTIQNYKLRWFRHISKILPKLWVTISHKGFLEFMRGHQEAKGQRTTEEMLKSIASWKPSIMH